MHERTRCLSGVGWMKCAHCMQSGVPEDAKAFDFIGYRELSKVLRGEMNLDEARAAIQQATRRYAKRQMTWFRPRKGTCTGCRDLVTNREFSRRRWSTFAAS